MLKLKKLFLIIVIAGLGLPVVFASADTLGQNQYFFVEKSFEKNDKAQVSATLQLISNNGYFYIADDWYQGLSGEKKDQVDFGLHSLANDFDTIIYPNLTSLYGSEWKPGIDNDVKVSILFHQMRNGATGYFRTQDEFEKAQAADSNAREMIFLNVEILPYSLSSEYLAHEFVHLITFNQKDRLQGVEEETWLNEARAEYAPTLLGFDEPYQGSYLEQRMKRFVESPRDSITQWDGRESDYGALDSFFHYFIERYGDIILSDSLKSPLVGIASLNNSLKKYSFNKTFSQIFTNWTQAMFLNDCSFGPDFCFRQTNLSDIKIAPSLILLPTGQETTMDLTYSIAPWSGNWYRIMGGADTLSLTFQGSKGDIYKIPYVICSQNNICSLGELSLDANNKASAFFTGFNKNFQSLTLMPSLQTSEEIKSFSLSLKSELSAGEQEKINQLLAQIAQLKKQIAEIQAKLAVLQNKTPQQDISLTSCSFAFESNLGLGSRSQNVSCLQKFLVSQGPDIYPQAAISGFYGILTKQAVIKFQEKYSISPASGFVGPLTRAQIKKIMSS